MNLLYVASRYHTNQIPIMKGWQEGGHKVMFLCQFQAGSEDYSVLKPNILGYSLAFRPIMELYSMFQAGKLKKHLIPAYFQASFGFPPMKKVKKIIREFRPDIVILRDRCVYNAAVYHYCKKAGIPGILYNQTPLWEEPETRVDFFHRVIRGACPQIRMTPVMGLKGGGRVKNENAHYIPFVVELQKNIREKEHFRNHKINILCIGKFEKRKHHLELLQTISEMPGREAFTVTLLGECSREVHREYLAGVREFIRINHMEEQVTILLNQTLASVYEEYGKADLFVLPSTGEFASVSQLEAMSCSLPVICSDTNGTANCVQEGINGYIFRDKDFNDLKEKLLRITQDRQVLLKMGAESYEIIREAYDFKRYQTKVLDMIAGR